MVDINSLCIGILMGMPIGIASWAVGKIIQRRYQQKHGCFNVCYHCGKPPFEGK